jgi:predicted unusual protein kinase regulating ubiquinone biosynthesis (AarF/ABC1/UbiB family)
VQDETSRWLLDHIEWIAGILFTVLAAATAHVLGFWFPARRSFERHVNAFNDHVKEAAKRGDVEKLHHRVTGAKSLMEGHARKLDEHTNRLDVFDEFGSRKARTLETRVDEMEKQWIRAFHTIERLEKWLARQEEMERNREVDQRRRRGDEP